MFEDIPSKRRFLDAVCQFDNEAVVADGWNRPPPGKIDDEVLPRLREMLRVIHDELAREKPGLVTQPFPQARGIKLETTPPDFSRLPKPTPGYLTVPVNTVEADVYPVNTYTAFDLTHDSDSSDGDTERTETVRIVDFREVMRVKSGRQEYEKLFDQRFPIRDTINPAWIHEDFCDDNDPTRVHPNVRLNNTIISERAQNILWTALRSTKEGEGAYENKTSDKQQFVEKIRLSCRETLLATMQNRPRPQRIS